MSYFVDAVLDGAVKMHDLDEEMCKVICAELARRNRELQARTTKFKRLSALGDVSRRADIAIFQGVYLESDVEVNRNVLAQSLKKVGGYLVGDRMQAKLFVVAHPAALAMRILPSSRCLMDETPSLYKGNLFA